MTVRWALRADRTGFPEVIWGANKTPLQLVTIMRKLIESEDKAVATRVDAQACSLPMCEAYIRWQTMAGESGN